MESLSLGNLFDDAPFDEGLEEVEETKPTIDNVIEIQSRQESSNPRGRSLFVDAPLEHRIAYLDSTIEITSEWLSAGSIAKNIGSNDWWVIRMMDKLPIEGELRLNSRTSNKSLQYPPITLELLREEWQWQQAYLQLSPSLSANEIAEFSGRSTGWVLKTLNELGTPSRYRKRAPLSRANPRMYPRTAVRDIRAINLAHMPDQDWLNLGRLELMTGYDRLWIEHRLSEHGLTSEVRRSSLTGKLHEYYPPESLEILEQSAKARAKPGAEWLTAYGLSSVLNISGMWINGRIEKYSELAELRQDDRGVSRLHYPPSVYSELFAELTDIQEHAPSGEYVTLSHLTKILGRSALWVVNRMPYIEVTSEVRRDKKNRLKIHYSPDTAAKLAALSLDILKSSKAT